MITGFRLGLGGAQGALRRPPDLTCFGKVIGGGLPIGAFGGRADVMASLAPLGPVYQAGTLSGNPLATAAGLAALDLLDDVRVRRAGPLGPPASPPAWPTPSPPPASRSPCPSVGPLVGLHFSATPAVDYDTARTTDEAAYARFFHALLRRGRRPRPRRLRGGLPRPGPRRPVLDQIIAAAHRAALTLASRREV